MARPRSDEKRTAILSAATRVIAAQGLGAATATIAKAAGVSNGSLFTYFETKADLLNQLYLELKVESAAATLEGVPAEADIHQQSLRMWSNSVRWASAYPDKRRTLAHLGLSDDITPASREAGHQIMAGVAKLIERGREGGPLRHAPLGFVVALMNALMDTTIDIMIREPPHAEQHSQVGFEALRRMLG